MPTHTEVKDLNEKVAHIMGWATDQEFPDFCRDTMATGHMIAWLWTQALPFHLDATDGYTDPTILYSARIDDMQRSSKYQETPGLALAKAIVMYSESIQNSGVTQESP